MFSTSRTVNSRSSHPLGSNEGKHQPDEGPENSNTLVSFATMGIPSISSMVADSYARHSNGSNNGKHIPTLLA